MKKKRVVLWVCGAIILFCATLYIIRWSEKKTWNTPDEEIVETEKLFGIEVKNYTIENGEIESGESLSVILRRNGMDAALCDRVCRKTDEVFPVKNLRTANNYTIFFEGEDSLRTIAHFVYEQNLTDYLVLSIKGDSISVREDSKPVKVERKKASATIKSSLWNAMIDGGMSPALAMELSDVYAWSIDFFGLQQGDNFTVLYDQRYIDTTAIGVGRIWGAIFNHNGKEYMAIPFKQGDKITYWDEQGNSLRKNLLKAPLKYSRISSKFSNGRMHPILKIVRPHHGVDYSAPSGTPIMSVADGVVTHKGWAGGGGNCVKIKHSMGYTSSYMHLRGYAKGIAVGRRVSQGDIIGYVGSTGLSTGPHLDFRLYKGSKAINPLTAPTTPTEPISKENMANFEFVRDRILQEIRGQVDDSMKITQLDSLKIW